MSRTIGRAALVVSAGILLSRILGFLRNVLLYGLLGRDVETDLYVAAFTIPDYLFFLMAGGYLSITLVPILSDALERDRAEVNRSFSAVFTPVAAGLVALTAVALVLARPLTAMLFPAIEQTDRLVGLTRIALAAQVFFGLGTLLMAYQYAHRRFLVPTLAPLLYNLGIIAGGAVGAVLGRPSPEAFLWGGLGGAALGNFALQWWGARREGMRFVREVGLRHPAVPAYLAMALPLMVGQSVVALDEQWPRLFGQLAGEAAVAGLYAARQLNMLPVGVIAQAAGVAAFPFLAGLFAAGRSGEMGAAVARSVRTAVAFAGLAAAVVAALAVPIVRLAYERGEFTASDTRAVAPLLAIYAISIPFWAAHQVYTRAFYASRRMWMPVGIGTGVTLLTVPALFLAVLEWGPEGVAGVSVASVAVYTVAVGLLWRRTAGGDEEMGAPLAKIAAMAVASYAATAISTAFLPEGSSSEAALSLVVGGLVALAVYLGSGRLLGSREVERLVELRRERSNRGGPVAPPAAGR